MPIKTGLSFAGTTLREPRAKANYAPDSAPASNFGFDDSDDDDDIPYENPHTGERGNLKRGASPSGEQPASKSFRVVGGKAAVPKKIVADYDSDDGRIITLKSQGYSDEYVSQKMISEGRIRYVPKTVGSRWLRLRKALNRAEDEKLDDELSDWHVGEDEHLREAYEVVDAKFKIELEKLMAKKWKEVSDNVAERLQKKKYTGRACKERFSGLQDGTALLPIEIDPDQAGRKKMREDRVEAARKRRADHAAELQRADEEKTARTLARKQEANEKERVRIEKANKKQAELYEIEREKKARAAAKQREKERKAAAVEQYRAETQWKRDQREAERTIYLNLTGKRLANRRRRTTRDDSVMGDTDEEDDMDFSSDEDVEMADDESEDDGVSLHCEGPGNGGGVAPTAQMTTSLALRTRKPVVAAEVTQRTLLSPRSIMSVGELDVLLHERDLARRGVGESHPQVVARICAADDALSTSELHDLLGRFFDKLKGPRVAKIQRLAEYDASKSAAGEAGVKSTDPDFKNTYEGYRG